MAKLELDELDQKIVKYLRRGKTTTQVSKRLKKLDIKPNSISTVEARLALLREKFKSNSMFQLACKLKENNLI